MSGKVALAACLPRLSDVVEEGASGLVDVIIFLFFFFN
jgi:hypothetical protein